MKEIYRLFGGKDYNPHSSTKRITTKFPRPCLECGKPHTHNNAFCSSFHAKQWREKNPNQGRVFA